MKQMSRAPRRTMNPQSCPIVPSVQRSWLSCHLFISLAGAAKNLFSLLSFHYNKLPASAHLYPLTIPSSDPYFEAGLAHQEGERQMDIRSTKRQLPWYQALSPSRLCKPTQVLALQNEPGKALRAAGAGYLLHEGMLVKGPEHQCSTTALRATQTGPQTWPQCTWRLVAPQPPHVHRLCPISELLPPWLPHPLDTVSKLLSFLLCFSSSL